MLWFLYTIDLISLYFFKVFTTPLQTVHVLLKMFKSSFQKNTLNNKKSIQIFQRDLLEKSKNGKVTFWIIESHMYTHIQTDYLFFIWSLDAYRYIRVHGGITCDIV